MKRYPSINEVKIRLPPLTTHSKIVVGVPCFNEEAHIADTIQSLLDQTCIDFSVLISDNASTDRTTEIIRDLVGFDKRFNLFCQSENIGSMGNFNFLRERTESKYFIWLGAHDIIDPTFIEYHVQKLDAEPRLSVSQNALMFVDQHGRQREEVSDGNLSSGGRNSILRYFHSIGRNKYCIAINSVMRRDCMTFVGFSAAVGTDRIIISHLAYKGPFGDTRAALYKRRCFIDEIRPSYTERLTGNPTLADGWFERSWNKMAAEYDSDICALKEGDALLPVYRILLQIILRYYLPVKYGTIITSTLWSIRRIIKYSSQTTLKVFNKS